MEQEISRNQEELDKLGAHCYGEFKYNESLRRDLETEWVENIRQIKGIYDPDQDALIPPDGSKIYPKYTRSKTTPCIAKLNSMLFPDNDRNWSIEPTPSPKLSDEQLQELVAEVVRESMEAGKNPGPKDVQKKIDDFARTRCEAMQTEMDDQLTEMQYKEICKKVIKSGVWLGTGVLKGPLAESYIERKVVTDKSTGLFRQVEVEKFKPTASFVLLFHWYPDMTVTETNEMAHSYELHMMNKHELRKLGKKKHFFEDTIKEIIKENPSGNYQFKQWQIDLQNIGATVKDTTVTGKYEVLERWGYVDGYYLAAAGLEIPEDEMDEEFFANIWICGQKVIKARMHPIPDSPSIYNTFYFSKDESSIAGEGLPHIVRDTALTIAAAARMMLDNGAAVAGPQFEINVEYAEEGQDLEKFHSRKVWYRHGRGNEANYPMIRALELESHIDDFIAIINTFKQIGDEESSMPADIFGGVQTGSNETARGTSIRSANSQATLADVVKSFDECNEGFLRSLYKWNMEFSDKEEIKGDYTPKASGSTSLMAKEARTQALDYFATTLTPADEPYINRREFLLERAKIHDLPVDRIILTEEAANEKIAAQMEQQAKMNDLATQQAMTKMDLDKAKAEHTRAKADSEEHSKGIKEIDAGARAAQAMAGVIKQGREKKDDKRNSKKTAK